MAVVAGLSAEQVAAGDRVSIVCRAQLRPGEMRTLQHDLAPGVEIVETSNADAAGLGAAFESLSPDVIHIHGVWEAYHRWCANWARKHRVPWVLSTHGMLHPVPMSKGWFKKRVYLALLGGAVSGARRILVTSEEEREYVSRLTGRPTLYMPNGVDPPADNSVDPLLFRRSVPRLGDVPYLLFLGRIHEIKGIDKLVRSYAVACRRGIDADLVLAGPEDGFGAEARRLALASGVGPRVHLTGAVYGAEKASALAGCAAFVHRPNYEGFGLTVIEAMAAGRPVITTTVCGVARACPGDVMYVSPDTDEGFGAAVANGLAHTVEFEAMARRGLDWVRSTLSWKAVAARVRQAYE